MNSWFFAGDPLGDMISSFQDWSFRLSGPVICSLMIMGLVALFFLIAGIQARFHDPLKPAKGPLFLAEWLYEYMEKWSRDSMGRNPRGFVGYFMGLFVYLFLAFIWSVTGMPSVIDYFVVPLTLSTVMFFLIQITAIRYQKWGYFHRYIEPLKIWLPINLITVWTPIISTSLRMFGNALAGSVIIGLVNWATRQLSATLFSFMGEAGQIVLGPAIIGVFNLYFSLFSGFIQTLVFASLNAAWIGQEMPEDDPMGTDRQVTRGKDEVKAQ
ncbi:MAG: FoF1 ATP synthase subunit a [Candidatus Enteromonas sp.]|nr:FoF1 ATP synthase subunit a [Candidatus Enteromonas sp.]MDY6093664.1 FoF1 ATP synthase subunit a [Candidatus Enteromonas sp.]